MYSRSSIHGSLNFYPRPPRGGRRGSSGSSSGSGEISIHALREEGDPSHLPSQSRPCEFLSTPSARRATIAVEDVTAGMTISIHALREEGDRSPGKERME